MTIVSAQKCDIGLKRNNNDDYVWANKAMGLYILADGMGGREAGDIASKMAANTVGEIVVEFLTENTHPFSKATLQRLLTSAIESANSAVYDAATQAGQKEKMGTTIAVVLLYASSAFASHVGDSRIYLARGSNLTQLTEDDSFGAQFAAAGIKPKADGKRGKFDHFLTKSVGQEAKVDPSFLEIPLEPGDWLLLCSDGLWGMADDVTILAELKNAGNDPEKAVTALVNTANKAGGKDNISVIAIKRLD